MAGGTGRAGHGGKELPQPSAGSAVGIFCSFQEGLRKRAVSKAVAWKVALLFLFGFPKLSVETFNFRRKTVLSLKTTAVPEKAFWGEMRYFCLQRQTKAAQLTLAAGSGAGEQQCGGDGCPSCQSVIPVHHNREIIPVVPTILLQGLICIHSTPVPRPQVWPGSPAKPPEALRALRGCVPCWNRHHSRGTRCILASCWEPAAGSEQKQSVFLMRHPQRESRSLAKGRKQPPLKKTSRVCA